MVFVFFQKRAFIFSVLKLDGKDSSNCQISCNIYCLIWKQQVELRIEISRNYIFGSERYWKYIPKNRPFSSITKVPLQNDCQYSVSQRSKSYYEKWKILQNICALKYFAVDIIVFIEAEILLLCLSNMFPIDREHLQILRDFVQIFLGVYCLHNPYCSWN